MELERGLIRLLSILCWVLWGALILVAAYAPVISYEGQVFTIWMDLAFQLTIVVLAFGCTMLSIGAFVLNRG